MFQLQLVSLHQKVSAKVLMDSLESLLDKQRLQFWRQPVSLADDEMAAEEPQRAEVVVAERTTAVADKGNIRFSSHEEEGIGAVAKAAVQHGAGKDLAVVDTAAAGHADGWALGSLAAGRAISSQEEKEEEEEKKTCPECETRGKVVFLACDAAGKRHDFCWN